MARDVTRKYTRIYHDGTRAPSIVLLDGAEILLENQGFEDFIDTIDAEIEACGFYDDSDPSNNIICLYMSGWPQGGD